MSGRASSGRVTRRAAQRLAHQRRAALVATVLFTLGTAGHAMASAAMPSPVAVMFAGSVAWTLGYGFAQRRRHWLATLGLVVGVQAVLHLLLAVVDSHGAHGHVVAGTAVVPMLAAHAVASLAGLLAIVLGDAVIAAWSRFVAAILGARSVRILVPAMLTIVLARATQHVPTRERALAWSLRGPPVAA